MQLTDFQQEMLRAINSLLEKVPVIAGMRGITLHSGAGIVHIHIESVKDTSMVELTFWTHSSQDRIQWLKGFMAWLTDKRREVASEELEPDPAHKGGFKVSLNAKYLYGRPGKLQIIWEGSPG